MRFLRTRTGKGGEQAEVLGLRRDARYGAAALATSCHVRESCSHGISISFGSFGIGAQAQPVALEWDCEDRLGSQNEPGLPTHPTPSVLINWNTRHHSSYRALASQDLRPRLPNQKSQRTRRLSKSFLSMTVAIFGHWTPAVTIRSGLACDFLSCRSPEVKPAYKDILDLEKPFRLHFDLRIPEPDGGVHVALSSNLKPWQGGSDRRLRVVGLVSLTG